MSAELWSVYVPSMTEGGGLREAANDVARHASAVARLQAELTRSELRSSGVLGFGAAVFAVMAFLLLTTLLVAALAIPFPVWLAILIVMLVYMALAVVLGAAFRKSRQAGVAKDQARVTAAALGLGRRAGTSATVSRDSSISTGPPPQVAATEGPDVDRG
jgi:hypothetical protein